MLKSMFHLPGTMAGKCGRMVAYHAPCVGLSFTQHIASSIGIGMLGTLLRCGLWMEGSDDQRTRSRC